MKILPLDSVRAQRLFNTRPVEVSADRYLHAQGSEGPFRIYVTYGPPSAPNIDPAQPYLTVFSPDWHAVYAFRERDVDASTYGFEPPEEGYELTLPLFDFRPMWANWDDMARRKRVEKAKKLWTEQHHGLVRQP